MTTSKTRVRHEHMVQRKEGDHWVPEVYASTYNHGGGGMHGIVSKREAETAFDRLMQRYPDKQFRMIHRIITITTDTGDWEEE